MNNKSRKEKCFHATVCLLWRYSTEGCKGCTHFVERSSLQENLESKGLEGSILRVNWFADDKRGIMYVREWDTEQEIWTKERAIERLSHVAHLLNRLQVLPNKL